jgi:hypothetical protein
MRSRAFVVFCLLLVTTSVAQASPEYPSVLQDELSLACSPSCLLCHTQAEGGFGTANTPFGTTLRRARLECCNDEQLAAVLVTLEQAVSDSDGDGMSDLDELEAGSDPNTASGALDCAAKKSSGCAAAPYGTWPPGLGWAVTAAGGVLALALRRRRGHARRAPRT